MNNFFDSTFIFLTSIISEIKRININTYFDDNTLFQIHGGIVTITFGIIILIFGYFREFDKIEKQIYLNNKIILLNIILIFCNYFFIPMFESNIIPLIIIIILVLLTIFILIDLFKITKNTNYYINRIKKVILKIIRNSVKTTKKKVNHIKKLEEDVVKRIRNDLDEITYILYTKINSNNLVDKNIARMIVSEISLPKNYNGIEKSEYSRIVYYCYIKVLHSNVMEMIMKEEYDNPNKIIYIIELLYESMRTIIENGFYDLSPNSLCAFQLYQQLPNNIEKEIKNITYRYGYELFELFLVSMKGKKINKEKVTRYITYNYMLIIDDPEFEVRVKNILTNYSTSKKIRDISAKVIQNYKNKVEH